MDRQTTVRKILTRTDGWTDLELITMLALAAFFGKINGQITKQRALQVYMLSYGMVSSSSDESLVSCL